MPKTTKEIVIGYSHADIEMDKDWYSEEEHKKLIQSERLKIFSAIMISGAIDCEEYETRYKRLKRIFDIDD